MRIGLVSDIHGNLPALERVLEALYNRHNCDEIWCAGDIVGSIGWPAECLHRVLNDCTEVVYGNHDARVRSDRTFVPEWPIHHQEHRVVTDACSDDDIERLTALPDRIERTVDGVDISLTHANPTDVPVDGYPAANYPGKRKWPKIASQTDADVVVFGHTHDQDSLNAEKFGHDVLLLNPGSVGVPPDGTADYAVLDTEGPYPITGTADYDDSVLGDRWYELDIEQNPSWADIR